MNYFALVFVLFALVAGKLIFSQYLLDSYSDQFLQIMVLLIMTTINTISTKKSKTIHRGITKLRSLVIPIVYH